MAIEKIEHIGIAVSNMQEAIDYYTMLLGYPSYKTEVVENQGIRTVFFQIGDIKIELLEATKPDSPIQKFLQKHGPGLHHIAFKTNKIEQDMQKMIDNQIRLLNPEPVSGADNKLICFLHPKDTLSVLTEFCMDK